MLFYLGILILIIIICLVYIYNNICLILLIAFATFLLFEFYFENFNESKKIEFVNRDFRIPFMTQKINYNNSVMDPLYEISDIEGYDIDIGLTNKQKEISIKNKKAIDGKVRSTKNIYHKYFTNELDENEKRVWYSAEAFY